MAQHGGPRTPSKPAPVSGPGALSKRTDGGPQPMRDLPDAGYGEQAQFREAQGGAPMAGGPPSASPPQGEGGSPPVEVTPFGAPSARPDEPVTHGADSGPGPGLDSLGLQDPNEQLTKEDMAQLEAYLPYLEWMASLPNAAPGTRSYVRRIKGML